MIAPPQLPSKPRWRRRKEARPDEIVDAALEVFAGEGFAAARLDDIAHKAGVSKGTLYLYFDTKEDLFKAVIRRAVTPNIDAAATLARDFDGPTGELIRAIITMLAAKMGTTRLPQIIKLFIGEVSRFPDLGRFYVDEVVKRGLGLMTSVVRRGVERGEFRDIDVDAAARLVMAPMLFSAIWKSTIEPVGGPPLDLEAVRDTHLDILLRGLGVGGELEITR